MADAKTLMEREQIRSGLLDKEMKLFAEKVADLKQYALAADIMTQDDRDINAACQRAESLMVQKCYGAIFRLMADAVRETEGIHGEN